MTDVPELKTAKFMREKFRITRAALGVGSFEDLLDVLYPLKEHPDEQRRTIVSRMYKWNRADGDVKVLDPEFFDHLKACLRFPPELPSHFLATCSPQEFLDHLPVSYRRKAGAASG